MTDSTSHPVKARVENPDMKTPRSQAITFLQQFARSYTCLPIGALGSLVIN